MTFGFSNIPEKFPEDTGKLINLHQSFNMKHNKMNKIYI